MPISDERFGKPVRCENPAHQDMRLKRLADVSGLQYSDLERRLDDIEPNQHNGQALAGCRQIIDRGHGWLWLHGGAGNGKSEMLIAVVNEINIFGAGPAMYIRFTDLLDYMRRSFYEQDNTYSTRFEKILNIPVLAIDEMDKARATEFVNEFRFAFLDDRYRRAVAGKSATLFASNADPIESLPEPLWDRARDARFNIRLGDGSQIPAIIENTQPSARPAMKAEGPRPAHIAGGRRPPQ